MKSRKIGNFYKNTEEIEKQKKKEEMKEKLKSKELTIVKKNC